MVWKLNFAKKSAGVSLIEAAITLPVICYIILFILEVFRINYVKSAIDSIAMEAALDFVNSKNTTKFAAIIQKYKPKYTEEGDIAYYFDIYPDLVAMCDKAPYGGEEIFWPIIANGKTTKTYAEEDYMDTNKDGSFLARNDISINLTDYSKPELDFNSSKDEGFQTLSGKAFILTVVCNYKFSSPMVSKLLSDGVNTVGRKKFLIWGRGVGVCN